jgi:hypothetical protein
MSSDESQSDYAVIPDAVITDEPRRHPIVWLVYAMLYAVAIPWYWPEGYRGPLVLGLPAWAAVSLAATLALAAWTAFVIYRFWDEGTD